MMFVVELPPGALPRHEIMALERSEGSYLLPVTLLEEGDGSLKLHYRTEGYLTIADYDFHSDLYRVFKTLKGYVRKIYEAQDMLLRTDMLFSSGDRVFVSPDDCAVRLVYGGHTQTKDSVGAIAAALLPVLAAMSGKRSVTGAKPAMTQLARRIKAANPGYETALRIIETVERQWNYMQPAGL